MARLDALFERLARSADDPYLGEPVSQLAHALQAADLATRSGASDALIAAALLHDVGHLSDTETQMPGLGVVDHERVGGAYLRALGFGDDVLAPVEDHVRAKRWLVARRPGYLAMLSPASVATLALQGGPLPDGECDAFEKAPAFRDALRLRAWDEHAKDPDWSGPPLAAYVALLETLIA